MLRAPESYSLIRLSLVSIVIINYTINVHNIRHINSPTTIIYCYFVLTHKQDQFVDRYLLKPVLSCPRLLSFLIECCIPIENIITTPISPCLPAPSLSVALFSPGHLLDHSHRLDWVVSGISGSAPSLRWCRRLVDSSPSALFARVACPSVRWSFECVLDSNLQQAPVPVGIVKCVGE